MTDKKENKVLILGSLAFDYIMGFEEKFTNAVSIDHIKEEYQSTITASSRIQHFGGTAGNITYNLGLLNFNHVTLVGAVGKDFESLGYKSHISRFKNIDMDIDIHLDDFTAACYIVNDVKANQMIIFHGGALDRCKDIDLKEKIDDPQNYVYAINSTQSVDAMVNFARQLFDLKIPIIFDPGQVTPLFPKELLTEIIKKSEIIIGNKFEIDQILEKTNLEKKEILNHIKGLITTLGEQGSELIYKDENGKLFTIEIPICEPEQIKDTTGAGDAYRAGILSGLTLDMNLIDTCRLGSIVSSFVIETTGAQTHHFNILDVRKRFLETYDYVPNELEGIKPLRT
ncbi:MAG: hypothetical protein GF317_21355 [Candidatus Lokiarchaeota archaeon]|nr:hypothetical protein [Candidatus Lokiarchaeota archaeon]MBD3202004.1 hypothetical protein [Candidatus Lokiarchaeota archaeon]